MVNPVQLTIGDKIRCTESYHPYCKRGNIGEVLEIVEVAEVQTYSTMVRLKITTPEGVEVHPRFGIKSFHAWEVLSRTASTYLTSW